MRHPLTSSQRHAATHDADRLYIESVPGSGKTTVAAERFGLLRFSDPSRTRVLGLSFTRAATAQLRHRVRDRWGPTGCRWPHRVITFDTLVRDIIGYLLRTGAITWPGGHIDLDVIDHWRGHRGYRWLEAGAWTRAIDLDGTTVSTRGVRYRTARLGFSKKDDLEAHLLEGRCTHLELRQLLQLAIQTDSLATVVRTFLAEIATDVLVDEVFDANPQDVWLIEALSDGPTTITLIGDPWQAIYGFRNARPDLVTAQLSAYTSAELPESHRFRTADTQETARRLRDGAAVNLATTGQCPDVVLATHWEHLWDLAGPDVLPLSIGQLRNQSDAALLLLLDHVVRARLGVRAVFVREALGILGIEDDALDDKGASLFATVLAILDAHGPAKSLAALRAGVKADLGAASKPRRGGNNDEAAEATISKIGERRVADEGIPGLTVHQAKGREWNHVGFVGPEDQHTALAGGLAIDVDMHRVLYVALTRGRDSIGRI